MDEVGDSYVEDICHSDVNEPMKIEPSRARALKTPSSRARAKLEFPKSFRAWIVRARAQNELEII